MPTHEHINAIHTVATHLPQLAESVRWQQGDPRPRTRLTRVEEETHGRRMIECMPLIYSARTRQQTRASKSPSRPTVFPTSNAIAR